MNNSYEYKQARIQKGKEQNRIEQNSPGLLGTRALLNEMAETNILIIVLGIEPGRAANKQHQ
jgi:hypothetical protein